MSTPSGKPFDPIRISDYAPKTVRDRLAAAGERRGGEQPDRPARPHRVPDESPLRTKPDERFNERPPAPLAPVGPHEHSRAERDRQDDGEEETHREPPRAIPRAVRSEHEHSDDEDDSSEADAVAEEEKYSGEKEGEDAAPRSAFAAHTEAYEVDLQRLESDLEALRSAGGEDAVRLPPAGQLPPARGTRRSRETYIDGIRLPRSLEPSYLPPPPMRDRINHLGAVGRIVIACAVAAPLTYFLVSYFSAGNDSAAKRGTKIANVETQLASLPPMPQPQVRESAPVPQPQTSLPAGSAVQQPAPAVQQPAPAVQQPAPAAQSPVVQQPPRPFTLQSASPSWPAPAQTSSVAAAPPNPAPAPARVNPPPAPRPSNAAPAPAPAPRPVPRIDPEEIAILLKQGEQFVSTGDVVTARLLFERVAEAGNASGALALGATYDPAVLTKLGVRGISPDVAKARQWYERARDLGSAEARSRLETLALR